MVLLPSFFISGIVENVGRPLVGLQGSIDKNLLFLKGDPQGASLHFLYFRYYINKYLSLMCFIFINLLKTQPE